MSEVTEGLALVNAKYKTILDIWFQKHQNQNGHKLYNFFVNMKAALNGGMPNMTFEILDRITRELERLFPDDRFFPASIELSDSENDDDKAGTFMVPQPSASLPATIDVSSLMNDDDAFDSQQYQTERTKLPESTKASVSKPMLKRPQNPLGSIAEYKTKSLKLKPASSYAKPSGNENNRPKITITVPYKKPPKPAHDFDPKKEAEKLSLIKEKIYLDNYIKIDQSRKEELEGKFRKVDMVSTANKVADVPVKQAVIPAKQTVIPLKKKRRQTCYYEEPPQVVIPRRSSICLTEVDTNNNHAVNGNKRDTLRPRKTKLSYNEDTNDDVEKPKDLKEVKQPNAKKSVHFSELPDEILIFAVDEIETPAFSTDTEEIRAFSEDNEEIRAFSTDTEEIRAFSEDIDKRMKKLFQNKL